MQNLKNLSCLISVVALVSGCKSVQHESQNKSINVEHDASTYARFVPERKDDFAWENDLVAFRMYGPAARSGAENAGLDCWLKRVKTPIVDKWYRQMLQQGKSYHKDWGEGLDNYHVGSSAGCGSSALWINGKREPLETFVDYKILQQTNAKTIFTLDYKRIIDGVVYQESREIEIETGSRLFKVTSTYWKDGQVAADLPICVGLTTHDGAATSYWDKKAGSLATWEVTEGFGLGTGVLVNPAYINDLTVVKSKGIADTGHVLAIAKTNKNGKLEYYAGYGWEKAEEITDINLWKTYLKNFANHEAKFVL